MLRDFSSGLGGRAHKVRRQCGAHRLCRARWERARKADMSLWSMGYRAICGRKVHGGIRKKPEWTASSSVSVPNASQIRPRCTLSTHFPSPNFHCLHLCNPSGLITGLPTPFLLLLIIINMMARVIFYQHKSNHAFPLRPSVAPISSQDKE